MPKRASESRLGGRDNPFTLGSQGDRRYRYCKCGSCGHVAKCTPKTDFFTATDRDVLWCMPCTLQRYSPEKEGDGVIYVPHDQPLPYINKPNKAKN